MNRRCVHVEIDLAIPAEQWLASCEGAVDLMRSLPGLEWKLWLLDAAAGTAGGIYLFRDEAAAAAYVEGPVIAGLRTSPAVRGMRVGALSIVDPLSARTFATAGRADEARPGG